MFAWGQKQTLAAGPWKDIQEIALPKPGKVEPRLPEKFRLLELDMEQFSATLSAIPSNFSKKADKPTLEIELPLPEGGSKKFLVYNDPIMHPDLARRYPEIQTFAGRAVDDPSVTIRMDFSPHGFNAQILSDHKGSIYIAPVAVGDKRHHISYFKKDSKRSEGWKCLTDAQDLLSELPLTAAKELAGDCGIRHEYRLALACSGEYAAFHGGTKALALAAMNTTMNRVNGVYEREFSIRMNLVANNDDIIYLDGATDPFTDQFDAATTINDNQTNTDTEIGSGDYDIGHVFTRAAAGNPNGLAQTPATCIGGKARAMTGADSPVGDDFDIDFVAHEMGHQFSAKHTQYNGCNRNDATAVEPGSGSTIMGYAGICAPDVQPHSDDYFQTVSVIQIRNYVSTGSGNTCDNAVAIANSAPNVAAVASYSIPVSTPFVLTASGGDPDGNPITYCWEQIDAFSAPAQPMPPAAANATGPMFRSFDPTASPRRYFPALADILSNTNPDWEELPSIGRVMNFRVTVRDNATGGGCTAETDNTVTTIGAAGPFSISSIGDDGSCLFAGDNTTILWNVAGTTAAPINCANVDILLSLDGGANFSILLANDTPNDGSQQVAIPASAITAQGRIMVMASDNIFFDVNDNNFRIDCPMNRTVTDNPASGTYKVREHLETMGNVQVLPLTSAKFFAGKDIVLKPGFWAQAGSNFLARIQPCDPCVANRPEAPVADKENPKVYFYEIPPEDRATAAAASVLKAFAYPNPFDQNFMLQFDLPEAGQVDIQLFDFTGRLVQTVYQNNFLEAGTQQIPVSARQLESGVYGCRISGNGYQVQVKLVKIN